MDKRNSKGLSSFSIILLMTAFSVVGIFCLPFLKVQYSPNVPQNNITVNFSVSGASARAVESGVTSIIEGALSNVKSVTDISSVSYDGSGYVSLNFRKGTNIQAARFEVASRIRNIYPELNENVSYPDISLTPHGYQSRNALTYILKGDLPSKSIYDYAQNNILKPLSIIEGVENVLLNGETPFIWEIKYDASKLSSYGINYSDIRDAILMNFIDSDVGLASIDNGVFGVKIKTDSVDDFYEIPVKKVGNRILYIKDLCECNLKESQPDVYFRMNGLNSIFMNFTVNSDANLLNTVAAIKEEMFLLQQSFPEDITASIQYDSTEYIKKELSKIYQRTSLCLLLLLVFVFFAYGSWRYMSIVAITLVETILISVALYCFVGVRIHIYSLAGIAVSFGIIVDTTIVMADHYARYHNKSIFPALLSATLTTVAALLVIFLLPERDKVNLADFAGVISINLLSSLITATFLVPALQDYIPFEREIQIKKWNESSKYPTLIKWESNHKWVISVICVTLFVLSFVLFKKEAEKTDFYREPAQRILNIDASMPEGCSISQLNEVVKSMENYLAQFDQISLYVSNISSSTNASITVYFKAEYENTSFPDLLKNGVTSMAMNFGGAVWRVSGVNDNYFNNDVVSISRPYGVSLSGYNYDELLNQAEKLSDYLSRDQRVLYPEMYGENWSDKPHSEFDMKYDLEKLAVYGISPSTYFYALKRPLFSEVVMKVPSNFGYIDVLLKSSEAENFDLWNVLNTSVRIDSSFIKLSEIGCIEKTMSAVPVRRHNQSYEVNVRYDCSGDYRQAMKVTSDAVEYMQSRLPLGYRAEPSTGYPYNKNEMKYVWLLLLTIAIIFVICSIMYESFLLPLAIILMIPFSFIGTFISFIITDAVFDQGGFAALILLSGLTINAALYLIYEFKSAELKTSEFERYLLAFSNKRIPILLTVLSTVLGLIPFLFDGPGEVFWYSFAIGTIGGIMFSLIGIVLVLPLFILKGKRIKNVL